MLNPQRLDMPDPGLNEDLLNPVEVYRDFELLVKCPTVETLQWRRGFLRPGGFLLTTPFSPEKMDIYAIGNVIYKRDIDEAGFITGRRVIQLLDGDMRLIVEGVALHSLLGRRVISLEGSFTLQALLTSIVNGNFLAQAGSGRSMAPLLRLLPFSLSSFNENLTVEYRQRNALDVVVDLLEARDVGCRCAYNIPNRSLDLSFYDALPSDTVFDKEFNNVLEQDYFDDDSNYRNVVLVGDDFVYNNHIGGFLRREVSTSEPRENTEALLRQAAREALGQNRLIRSLSSSVDVQNMQYVYERDWTIGSRVLSRNRDIGFSEHEVITEILEFYDEEGFHLDVNMGGR